jgi:hypothetical protein
MYGYCRIRGDNILLQTLPSKYRVAFYLLGQGEFDGIERLWINKKLVNQADTTLVHFHAGQDGVLGSGLAATSTGGDQKADSFFTSIPSNFQPLTFSRKAYIAVNVPPDPSAPDANLDVIGDYRTARIRIFDSSGNQTVYQFSTNGAWQVLDLLLRTMLKPEWNTAAAAAAGGDLTTAEKARINFPAVVSAAQWCDTIISNGAKRFESSVAFTSTVKLQQALSQLLTMSQLYITEEAGQIYILPDQPRSSTFILTSDHVIPGTISFDKADLHGSANQLVATFNDLNPQDSADIDTAANSGLVRSGNVVTCKTKATHPYVAGDSVQIVNPDDASFAGVFPVTTVSDSLHFTYSQNGSNATSGNGYTGTPESRFAQRGTIVDHERHQNALGARGLNLNAMYRKLPLNIDMGNNTMERVQRLLNFLKNRNLGMDQVPYNAPFKGKLTAYLDAVDSNMSSLVAQLCGDIITIDSTVSEEFQGQYEITKKTYNLPTLDSGGGNSGSSRNPGDATIDLEMLTYIPSAFSDGTIVAQPLQSSVPRGNLSPAVISDNLFRNGDMSVGLTNWGGGLEANTTGWQFLTNVSGLPVGSSELKITLNSGQFTSPAGIELIPIDSSKIYLFECWVKLSGGGGPAWAGFQEFDVNKNYLQHVASGAALGYALFSSINSTTGWQYFAAEVTGAASSPTATQFNSAAAYMVGTLLFEPTNANSVLECCLFRISLVAAGAKRATSGLQASGQLQGTFKNNPVNSNGALTGGNPLSQSGTTTTINVAAFTMQFGAGQVSYNSGSVNPGSYGTWGVYCDDPSFSGGAVTYQATTNNHNSVAADGRVWLGTVTTVSGGGGTGTGGGTGSGGGARGGLTP